MRTWLKVFAFGLAFLLLPFILGSIGYFSSINSAMASLSDAQQFTNVSLPSPSFDPAKPTVAILLGDELTEVTDFLAPYQFFAASKAFNVYGVAPQHKPTTLTGGLDVFPHFSLAELDARLGRNPDIIVVPHIPFIERPQNKPLLEWIKRQAAHGAILLSICTGAGELAATGLLDGQTATTHWGDIDRLEKQFPAVRWVRGVRYVDNGTTITSAGLTSGIDATLHLMARFIGQDRTRVVAQQLYYTDTHFVDAPTMTQYQIEPADSIYLLNQLYNFARSDIGVMLYDDVDELALAAVFDTYAASTTTRLHTIALHRTPVITRFGLAVLPRMDFVTSPAFERVFVPGAEARERTANDVAAWQTKHGGQITYLHDGQVRFAYDAPLEDLARQQNNPTALFAAKRLEYRSSALNFAGSSWPVLLSFFPLLLGCVGLGFSIGVERLLRRCLKKK